MNATKFIIMRGMMTPDWGTLADTAAGAWDNAWQQRELHTRQHANFRSKGNDDPFAWQAERMNAWGNDKWFCKELFITEPVKAMPVEGKD